MGQQITLTVPDELYRRLEAAAAATRRPIDEVAIQSLTVGSPPGLDAVPERYHADLLALSSLSDDALWQIARTNFPPERFEQLEGLLAKQAEGLTPAEQETIAQLLEESNQFMLRRAYVYALLHWRGHVVPALRA